MKLRSGGIAGVPLLIMVLQAVVIAGVLISVYPAYLSAELKYVAVGGLFVVTLVLALFPMGVLLRQVAVTSTLLIAMNLVTTPFFHEPAPTLTPNYSERVRIVGDVMPGFTGVQYISTDSNGYRTNTSVDYGNKPAGVFRIFAIGGSTTEQIALGNEKTWVSLLAAELQSELRHTVEAVNTGVSGLRAIHHLATLRRISEYEPDLVIIKVGINDWNRHIKTRSNPLVEYFYDLTDYLDLKRSLLARGFRDASALLRGARQAQAAEVREENGRYFSEQNNSLDRAERRDFYPADVSSDYAQHLRDITDVCRSRNIRCLIVDQPTAYHPDISPEVRKRLWMTPPNEKYALSLENMTYVSRLYNSWLRDYTASVNLPFCGIADKLAPTTAFFFDDCHFNEAGARRVAQLLKQCIVQQKLAR